MYKRIIIGLVVAAAIGGGVWYVKRQTGPDAISYEQFMRAHSLDDRYALFQTLSPEKKAELMTEHYDRCLKTFEPMLTNEQIRIIKDARAAVSPGAYRNPPDPAASEKMRVVENKAVTSFPEDLGVQIFTLFQECKAR